MKTHDGESNPVRLGKMESVRRGDPVWMVGLTRKQSTWTCSRLGLWPSVGNSRAAKEIFESRVDRGAGVVNQYSLGG